MNNFETSVKVEKPEIVPEVEPEEQLSEKPEVTPEVPIAGCGKRYGISLIPIS